MSNIPKRALWFYEKYMMVMGPLTNLMFYLQAYKIFTSQQAAAISLPAFILSTVGVGSWLLYGIVLKSRVLVVSSAVGMLGSILVLVGIILYG